VTADASGARRDSGAVPSVPTPTPLLAKGALLLPVQGVEPSALHDTYSEQRGGGSRTHEALDIPAPRGTPVLSATGGRVLKLFDSKAGGKMVYAADSSERFILMYAHLDAYAPGLADGQPLKRGQVIGVVGTTGNAPPNVPHLHFAIARSNDVRVWWKGEPVNPFPLLAP
jgi:murein DD-endopeptidase MepM/ murein hydrolase activator NlpD